MHTIHTLVFIIPIISVEVKLLLYVKLAQYQLENIMSMNVGVTMRMSSDIVSQK